VVSFHPGPPGSAHLALAHPWIMSGNHEILEGGDGEVLVQYILEGDIAQEETIIEGGGDMEMMQEQSLPDAEGEQDDEQENSHKMLIFKTEGLGSDTVITYSIPVSNTCEYEDESGVYENVEGEETREYEHVEGEETETEEYEHVEGDESGEYEIVEGEESGEYEQVEVEDSGEYENVEGEESGGYENVVEESGEEALEVEADGEAILPDQYLTYQIIDGYLVPTIPDPDSEQPSTSARVVVLPTPETITQPIDPALLNPEALRKQSLRNPDELLIVYHCSFCTSAFNDFPSVKAHEAEHLHAEHSVLTNANPQTSYLGSKLFPNTGSKFSCPYCFMGFPLSANLRQHIRDRHKQDGRGRKTKQSRGRASPVEKKPKLCPASAAVVDESLPDNLGNFTAAMGVETGAENLNQTRTFMIVNSGGRLDDYKYNNGGEAATSFTYDNVALSEVEH